MRLQGGGQALSMPQHTRSTHGQFAAGKEPARMANAQALIVLAGQVGISPFRGRQIIQYGARSLRGRKNSKRNGADAIQRSQSEGAHSGHYVSLTIDPINRWQRRCSRMTSAAQAPRLGPCADQRRNHAEVAMLQVKHLLAEKGRNIASIHPDAANHRGAGRHHRSLHAPVHQ
jgi:hypothetical protein